MTTTRALLCLMLLIACSACNGLVGSGIIVHPDASRSARETGRAFLIRGEKEQGSYGLYSYLLFGSAPSDEQRPLYLAAAKAFLRISLAEAYIGAGRARWTVNITYLPLTAAPGSALISISEGQSNANGALDQAAERLVSDYDYVCARLLLSTLPGDRRQGPYIVSRLRPLSKGALQLGERVLLQDLTGTPPSLVPLWISEFQRCASSERFWEVDELSKLTRELRIGVERIARSSGAVLTSLTQLIALLKAGAG